MPRSWSNPGRGAVSGTIGVNDTVLATTVDVSEGQLFEWTATIDGIEVPMPASTFDGASMAFDVNNASFVCDSATLVLTSPQGATVTFDRA